jgi:Cu(I)/Ag(I) efflux system membrane protein CusA/SilA
MRSYQDWYLRYYLKSVPGVAEVAPLGGFGKQYQVNIDPNRLQAFGIPIKRVVEAVRGGNNEVGGRLLEFGGTEYMVRGRGYARSVRDFEDIVITASETGTPIRVGRGAGGDGPDIRRGVSASTGPGRWYRVSSSCGRSDAMDVIGALSRRSGYQTRPPVRVRSSL